MIDPLGLRDRLLEVVHPCGEVRVGVSFHVSVPSACQQQRYKWRSNNALIDVSLRRRARGVTADVDRVFRLVHANVVDPHVRREGERRRVRPAERRRQAEVRNHVLTQRVSGQRAGG
jgi:hypothetical protein